MAIRYIGVDSGKFATKVAEYDPKTETIRKFSIRTKASEGDFRDDAIEAHTVIVDINGQPLKVGNGARGDGAALDTDKKTDIHKMCVMTALATLASAKEKDEIHVAVGLPAKNWAHVPTRIDYKDFILPEGDVTVKIKTSSSAPVVEKTFTIKNRYVFPESIGPLFMDETINDISPSTVTGVIDIGNLNLNATYWQGTEYISDKSVTEELGGAMLIQELSQEISTNLMPCDEMIAANIIKSASTDRHLPDNLSLSDEMIEQSRLLIKKVLREHAEKIKRACRSRKWSLDLMKIIAIGGTSADIEEELRECFGNITVYPDATYCNVLGYLRMMCAKENELGKIIPLTEKA